MAKQIFMNQLEKKIRKFIHLLKRRGIMVSQVILFGSCAKGTRNAESDIDVVIVSAQFGENNAEEMISLRKIALKVDSRIEPIPLSPQDLEDPYSTLVHEIKQHGIVFHTS